MGPDAATVARPKSVAVRPNGGVEDSDAGKNEKKSKRGGGGKQSDLNPIRRKKSNPSGVSLSLSLTFTKSPIPIKAEIQGRWSHGPWSSIINQIDRSSSPSQSQLTSVWRESVPYLLEEKEGDGGRDSRTSHKGKAKSPKRARQ